MMLALMLPLFQYFSIKIWISIVPPYKILNRNKIGINIYAMFKFFFLKL